MISKSWFQKFFSRSFSTVSATNSSVAAKGDINAPVTIYNGVGEEHLSALKIEQFETNNKLAAIDDKLKNFSGISDKTLINDVIDGQLDARIDELGGLIKQRKVITALDLFEKLLEKETSKASHRILFRIKANIGICKLFLGKETEGANLLLEAYNFAPEEPKAISNRMIGLLLLQKNKEALEFGKKSLEQDQENEALAGYVIQASRFFDAISEPLNLVPENLHNTASVRAGNILFLISRKNKDWWNIASMALTIHPNDEHLKLYAAEAILDEITSNPDFQQYERLSIEQRQKVQNSKVILQELWNNAYTGENYFTPDDLSACCNLLLAYQLLNKHEEIRKICCQVIDKQIEDPILLERVAQVTINFNLFEISEKIISKLSDTPQNNLLKFVFYASKNQWAEISDITEQKIKELPLSEQPMVLSTAKLAKLKIAGISEINEVNLIFEEVKHDARACIAVANFSEEFGFEELGNQAYETALNLIDVNSDYPSRLMIASYGFYKQKWQDVITLLYGYVDSTCDSYELRNLTLSFINNRPIQEKAVNFFEEFPKKILDINFFIWAYGLFYFLYEKWDTAEKWLTKALENNKYDLGVFLALIEIYKKDRKDKAAKLVHGIDISNMNGDPIEKLHLAHQLKEYGRIDESLEYIYQLQKDYTTSPEIALGYFNFIIFADEKLIPIPTYVKVNCWISLKNQYEEITSFIICNKADSNDSNVYDLNHFFSRNALGLKIGELFIQSSHIGGDKTWTVVEIKHKYLYMLHKIMETFEQKFPDFHGLYRVKIVNNDISPFLEMVKKSSEKNREMANYYLEQQIPLAVVANLIGKDAISFSEYVRSLGEDIRTCIGTAEERLGTENLIYYNNSQRVVLDTYTVWLASVFDIFDILKSLFKSLLISQSTINEIRLLEEKNHPCGKSIGWNNNQYIRYELSIEDREKIAINIGQLRERIELNCEVLPVAVPDNVEGIGNLIELKKSLDSIYLAKKENCYLLSEDLYYRQLFSAISNNHWC